MVLLPVQRLRDAVEGFLRPWEARLGLAYREEIKPEHWARIRALSRRFAEDRRRSLAPRPPGSEHKRSKQVEEAFLDGLRGGWSISKSALAAGIHERTVRRWKADASASKQADDFAQRWNEAYECGVDNLEDTATRRGVEGVEKPVYQGGVLVGSVTEYSDTLLGLMLRGKRPKVYNTGRHEHASKERMTINTYLQIEFVEPEDGR
jgi:hypothetical protein